MTLILAHNHYDENHLSKVIEEMKVLGTPSIKVTSTPWYDTYQAIEGCHRLRACEVLGLVPNITILDDKTSIEDAKIDFNGCGFLVEDIGDYDNDSIDF